MANYTSIGNLWYTIGAPVRDQWLGACLKTAFDVHNESPETSNHAKRLAWATVILTGAEAEVVAKVSAMVRYALVTNAAFQTNPAGCSDSDVAYIIASQLDALNP